MSATALSRPGPPHYRGFPITIRHTTLGTTPMNKWLTNRRGVYLTTHYTHKRQTSMSPAQPQRASGRRPTPQTARPLGSAKSAILRQKPKLLNNCRTEVSIRHLAVSLGAVTGGGRTCRNLYNV